MEEDPSCYQDAAKLAAGEGLGAEMQVRGGHTRPRGGSPLVEAPQGLTGGCPQLDDVVGTHPDYNEEEEEQKYFRRKRLGVVKNVLAASLAAMLTYGVYLGTAPAPRGPPGTIPLVVGQRCDGRLGPPQACCRCSSSCTTTRPTGR